MMILIISVDFHLHIDLMSNDTTNLVKFNVNETGFYRVNYPEFMWNRFATRLTMEGPSAVW